MQLHWGSPRGCIHIRFDEFNYGCLDKSVRAMTAIKNFNILVSVFREVYASAVFSTALYEDPGECERVTASLPVDWGKGPASAGLVTTRQTSDTERMSVAAGRVLARSLLQA